MSVPVGRILADSVRRKFKSDLEKGFREEEAKDGKESAGSSKDSTAAKSKGSGTGDTADRKTPENGQGDRA